MLIAVLAVIMLFFFAVNCSAAHGGQYKLYVWEFGTRDGSRNELTASLTREFEEALMKESCVVVLERRNYDKLMSQKDTEKAIMAIDGISDYSLRNLKTIEASGVIFGEVYDDVQSGEIKVTARVQKFDGQNMAFDSVRLSRGRRFDAASRERSMDELAFSMCSSLTPEQGPAAQDQDDQTSAPVIHSFAADHTSVISGQSVTLNWSTSHVSSVTIRGSKGVILVTESQAGSHLVKPTASQTYILSVRDKAGRSLQRSISISVHTLCAGHTAFKVRLEQRPGLYTREQVQGMVMKRNFREHDWNPGGNFQNSFQAYDEVVVDCATGLMWQRDGSPQKIWTFDTAPNYIHKLNAMNFAGFNDWRLPTIEELSSLIEPWKNTWGLYIDNAFGDKTDFWSADDWNISTGTPVAWSANFDYGGIFHGGAKVNRFHVRGVRSIR